MKNLTLHSQYVRWVFFILGIEFIGMGLSGVWFSGLAGNGFISAGIDPAQWLFFVTGIPQTILANPVLAWVTDILMVAGLIRLFWKPADRITAIALFLLFGCYYSTLTACLGHRNFQAGMLWVFIPFLFAKEKSREMAYQALRYFIFFFYVSAAWFKITSSGLWQMDHMSRILSGQLAPYYLEKEMGWRQSLNMYLVGKPVLAQILFILSAAIELLPLAGFFTMRWDRFLGIVLIIFHLFNWVIMDIAPIGQLALLTLLIWPKQVCGSEEGK